MGALDILARAVAITILLFVVSLLVFSLLGYWLPTVAPLRQSFLLALLSVGCAAAPMLLIYLTRAATGAATGAQQRTRYFFGFAALSGVLAVLFATLIASGLIGV